jgi:hypothetical protein
MMPQPGDKSQARPFPEDAGSSWKESADRFLTCPALSAVDGVDMTSANTKSLSRCYVYWLLLLIFTLDFATPPTTDASGMFTDTPVGSCFNNNPPLTTNPCADVVKTFNIVMSGVTYAIKTTTTRRDCAKGIRIQVSNPAPGTSNTFSNGTVN